MSWKKLLVSRNVTREPSSKTELDNLRSIVARSMKDVAAPGLSADARFVMAYDAARTLSLMVVRAAGYRPRAGLKVDEGSKARVNRRPHVANRIEQAR